VSRLLLLLSVAGATALPSGWRAEARPHTGVALSALVFQVSELPGFRMVESAYETDAQLARANHTTLGSIRRSGRLLGYQSVLSWSRPHEFARIDVYVEAFASRSAAEAGFERRFESIGGPEVPIPRLADDQLAVLDHEVLKGMQPLIHFTIELRQGGYLAALQTYGFTDVMPIMRTVGLARVLSLRLRRAPPAWVVGGVRGYMQEQGGTFRETRVL
jgi:hypothetical protein